MVATHKVAIGPRSKELRYLTTQARVIKLASNRLLDQLNPLKADA